MTLHKQWWELVNRSCKVWFVGLYRNACAVSPCAVLNSTDVGAEMKGLIVESGVGADCLKALLSPVLMFISVTAKGVSGDPVRTTTRWR